MVECPHCGARIESSAGRCPNCGNMLAPDYGKPSYSAPDYGAAGHASSPDTDAQGQTGMEGPQAPAADAAATPSHAWSAETPKLEEPSPEAAPQAPQPAEPSPKAAAQAPQPGVEYYSGEPIRPKQATAGEAGTFGSTAKAAEPTTNYTASRGSAPSAGPCPSSHIFLSIISLICCCVPTGIVALINSFRVSSLWQAGRYSEAESASKSAKLWSLIGMGIVIAFWVAMAIYGSSLEDAESITDSITNLFDA